MMGADEGPMDLFQTFLNWRVFVETLPLILSGLSTTLVLGAVSILFSLVAGLLIATVRLYAVKPLRLLSIAYVDVFRAIPILVLLVVIYYALPFVGIRLSSFAAATAAISMVGAA